jgi:histidinol-phosphatase
VNALAGSLDAKSDLELAIALADLADSISASQFESPALPVRLKEDRTPVTPADLEVEAQLLKRIAQDRPGDSVLTEESGGSQARPRQWILDPIDGTANFLRHIPVWATLIALQIDGVPVVGVVSAPALGRRWWAARGLGAWCATAIAGIDSPKQCFVSKVARVADAMLGFSNHYEWVASNQEEAFRRLSRSVLGSRGFGDFWSHAMVAEGAVDLSCEPTVAPWDVAALQVIVEEAGGRFTDLQGHRRIDGGSVLCTNGLIHDEALSLLT